VRDINWLIAGNRAFFPSLQLHNMQRLLCVWGNMNRHAGSIFVTPSMFGALIQVEKLIGSS
jgi:hypothetical protein